MAAITVLYTAEISRTSQMISMRSKKRIGCSIDYRFFILHMTIVGSERDEKGSKNSYCLFLGLATLRRPNRAVLGLFSRRIKYFEIEYDG